MPVRVLIAAREHHDGLLREFRLLAMADGGHRPDMPPRLRELVEIFGVRFATRPRPQVESAVEQGLDSIDLTFEVSSSAVESAQGLEALLDEADSFCRSAHLVTPARKPVLREFARWHLH